MRFHEKLQCSSPSPPPPPRERTSSVSEHLQLADPLPGIPSALFAESRLPVRPWTDPVIDTLGFDPRSAYVERFWLGVLGPSTTWLLRRLADGFDGRPDGFDLDLESTARTLGLGGRSGRHAPFARAIERCVTFDLARRSGGGALLVRR